MFHALLLKNNYCRRMRSDQHACQMSLSWLRRGCATEHEWKPARAGPVMMRMNSHQMQGGGRESQEEEQHLSMKIKGMMLSLTESNTVSSHLLYTTSPKHWPSTHQPLLFPFWLRIICGKPGSAHNIKNGPLWTLHSPVAIFNTLLILCKVYDLKDSDPNCRLRLISFF